MNSYRTLAAWKHSHEALIVTFKRTDAAYHPRKFSLFDQIRRAVVSVEANIVEGYALDTEALFRKHLRIAFGSAAEAETLVRAAGELAYLEMPAARQIVRLLGYSMSAMRGLMRSPPVTGRS
jgi:four helix bundle protein